ncbi:PSD1 and planctomycete cytochrome C domain-containing protein [Maioricimonas rarisocia]|uniref:PSD1 and planctomycete cytochrome C domain-containing protein n=1 Tax=Maioricimonas rarisocia TaxID=2528026 RepID=UPI0018D22315|nr:PSD1 and planctomycete cytochrome C domain-containing protein [Maioricimonas rarisocia]
MSQRFEIQGTESRNNPLRRQLDEPYSGDELFVRYRLRYDARTIDLPTEDEGEFFVLWLDISEGSDASSHSQHVPNIGIHVDGDVNRFMVRYVSSAEAFGPPLEGDRDVLVVARLSKTTSGRQEPFDRLDLWIDPNPKDRPEPDAAVTSRRALHVVEWIGFSTGLKTEIDDRIEVWDIDVSGTWEELFGLPPAPPPETLEPLPEAERTVAFAEDVFPILRSRCFECHSGEDATEGVRLDVLDEVVNQTAPRDAASSRLFELVSNGEMPPDGPSLNSKELQVLRAWIDEGLHWDETLLPTPVPTTDHWAFQPVRRPVIPTVSTPEWIRTPVDAFIGRKHEERGLQPAPEADPYVLRRRLALDLLGLPPDPENTGVPYETLVEKFLTRPEYGERWGRHWLDVARWAESNGHQHNRHRSYAWRYRDWVVDAFASDKPYDAFVREQLAGDQLEPFSNENLVATGFLAAARYSGNELDKEIQRNDILVDVANTTAKAFLGLTLECAQCHTHKFDPISIRDYYRFQAFFAKAQPANVVFSGERDSARALIEERWRIFDSVHDRMVAAKRRQEVPEPIYVSPTSVVRGMNPEEKRRFNELEQSIAALDQTWAYFSPANASSDVPVAPHEMRWPLPRDPSKLEQLRTTILVRGDVTSRGPEVFPGWPAVFGLTPPELEKPRLALANWMTDPANPLTARVWVNRIWQWHFGRGLVETSGDFGTQGTPPTHPELLDFLASELIDSGWSTRHIHRLIVNSATYRQSSAFSAANDSLDPGNSLLWRWTPRRLESEAIRDCILAVSGRLDPRRGGPGEDGKTLRRSLYLRQRRGDLPHQQMLFDGSTGIVSCTQRRVSTTALQPLWLLNSQFVQDAATTLAERTETIDEAFRLALAREPTGDERAALTELVNEFGMESACLAILNASEFVYIP